MLLEPSTVSPAIPISGVPELTTWFGGAKVAPPSVDRLNKMFMGPCGDAVSIQVAWIFPLASSAMYPGRLVPTDEVLTPPLALEMVSGPVKDIPPSTELLETACGTPVLSFAAQTRAILLDGSTPMNNGQRTAGRVIGVENVAPPSTDRRKKMPGFPELLSNQATKMLPLKSTATCGKSADPPGLLERFTGVENVAPPSVERPKKTERVPGVLSSQTRLIWPCVSTAICGF